MPIQMVLEGWQEYVAGTDGRLEIKTSINAEIGGVFAMGSKTGEVRMKGLLGLNELTIIKLRRFAQMECLRG
ncbi:MAG: hypothetical protein IPN96_07155 [Anaerolineales bacterium]|nr:hypothetical protein [Anaerolineales bacterium]